MDFCFLCPVLGQFGFETGFSFRNPNWGGIPFDLKIERYRSGQRIDEKIISISPELFHICLWETDWGIKYSEMDLLVIRMLESNTAKQLDGVGSMEGQMLFRNDRGWTSSLLSGFVPSRPLDYRFSPIVHTAHYFAEYGKNASHTIFLNTKKCVEGTCDAGSMLITVRSRNGELLGEISQKMLANNTVALCLDDILDACGISASIRNAGVNLLFSGGTSQFSIFTLFQDRMNGSIGLEHSLAPFYYFPKMIKQPAIRQRLYSWLGK